MQKRKKKKQPKTNLEKVNTADVYYNKSSQHSEKNLLNTHYRQLSIWKVKIAP